MHPSPRERHYRVVLKIKNKTIIYTKVCKISTLSPSFLQTASAIIYILLYFRPRKHLIYPLWSTPHVLSSCLPSNINTSITTFSSPYPFAGFLYLFTDCPNHLNLYPLSFIILLRIKEFQIMKTFILMDTWLTCIIQKRYGGIDPSHSFFYFFLLQISCI